MFQVKGNLIELLRYRIIYRDSDDNEKTVFVLNEQEAQVIEKELEMFEGATGISISNTDTSALEWLNGIDVGTTDNAMQKAIKIYEMGKEKYLETLENPITVDFLKDENKQLKTRIAAQEESNKFLEDCIVEMAEIVYV